MALRDHFSKVLGKQKLTPRDDLKRAAQTETQKIAARERELQKEELKGDQQARAADDRIAERAKVAREHPQPHFTPDGHSQVKTRDQIEAQTDKALAAKYQQERDAIDRKPDDQLAREAADRSARDKASADAVDWATDDPFLYQSGADYVERQPWTPEERDAHIAAERERREARESAERASEREQGDPGREYDPWRIS